MEILLTLILMIIAICMVLGKGFKITINHTYETPELKEVKDSTTQKELDDTYKGMNDIVKSIQDFMEVNDDE